MRRHPVAIVEVARRLAESVPEGLTMDASLAQAIGRPDLAIPVSPRYDAHAPKVTRTAPPPAIYETGGSVEQYPEASGLCGWTTTCGGRATGLIRTRTHGLVVDVPVCERCRVHKPLSFRPFRTSSSASPEVSNG